MSCQADELSSLPLLNGCPSDNEWFLVGNAIGGLGAGGYARRLWVDIKRCIFNTVLPYIGVVGRGQPNDPTAGISTFTNAQLAGLGANHNGEIQIVYAEQLRSNFGENASFTYTDNGTTGTIDLDYLGSGETFNVNSTLCVDRNQ